VQKARTLKMRAQQASMRREEIPKARLWQSVWRAKSDSLQNWRWPPSTLRTLLPACRRVEMDEWVVEMSYGTGVDEKAWVARGRSCRQIVSVSLITNELARDVALPLEVVRCGNIAGHIFLLSRANSILLG